MLFTILLACSFISIYWLSQSMIELAKASLGQVMLKMFFVIINITVLLLAYSHQYSLNSFICY